ncbi:Uncharacterized protein PBTT_03916 [Plasmodiophora brassicae]
MSSSRWTRCSAVAIAVYVLLALASVMTVHPVGRAVLYQQTTAHGRPATPDGLLITRSPADDYASVTFPDGMNVVGPVLWGGLGSTMQRYMANFIERTATGRPYVFGGVPNTIEWGADTARVVDFFNLGDGEIHRDDLPGGVAVDVIDGEASVNYVDAHPFAIDLARPELRRKYLATAKPALPEFAADAVNIAVHIRRGYGASDADQRRIISNGATRDKLVVLVDAIRARTAMPVRLNVYSSGAPADFTDLDALDPVLHLDTDTFATVHALVMADVLVMAHSSFSYVAALLNDNLVIYDPFWHSPAPTWIVCQDGRLQFNDARSVTALRRMLQRVAGRSVLHPIHNT